MNRTRRLPVPQHPTATASLHKAGLLSLIPAAGLLLLLALLWLMGALPSLAQSGPQATTRYVAPGGSGTACTPLNPCALQTAANQSANGDTIKVRGGTYASAGITPTLTIATSVAIYGGYNANYDEPPDPQLNETILDGQNTGRVVVIQGSISPILDGFTIRSGLADLGGGIYNPSGSPAIRHNHIYDNQASSGNQRGGGIYDGGSATIEYNTLHNNTAQRGGAIFVENPGGSSSIRFNEIYANTANGTSPSGGGIHVGQNGQAFIEGNSLHNNTSSGSGGGLSTLFGSSITAQSNLIYDNSATGSGGGLYILNSATLWNNTLVGNSAGGSGGGINIEQGTTTLRNNIVAFNTAPTNDGIHNAAGSVSGGYNNLHDDLTNVTLSNPISGDPTFVNLGSRNLHLASGSPNINSGDPATPGSINIDIDGQARPYPAGGRIDVGADEYYPDYPAFTFTPTQIDDFVNRSSQVNYQHTLENIGTVADTYTFTCSNSLNWSVTCPSPVNNLGSGGSASVQTSVQIPDAAAFTTNQLLITATSTFSPELQALVVVNLTVNPLPGVSFTPDYSGTLKPGEAITYTHNLTNTGDFTDTFAVELTSNPDAWAELLPSNNFQLQLAPGQTEPVQIVIRVSDTAPAGLAHTFQIQATSLFSDTYYAIVSDTITAKATIGTRYVATTGTDTDNNCTVKESPCATVARGISQAVLGDAVHIATGQYNEASLNLNNTIFIEGGWVGGFASQGDPDATIINGQQNGRIFNVAPGVQPVINNLTLRNGRTSSPGGAIFIGNTAQVQLTNLIFEQNQGSRGGAVYVATNGFAGIATSSFLSNTALIEGGALYISSGTANIHQNRFIGNNATNTLEAAAGDGGAIFINTGLLFLENNLFHHNSAVGSGGALYINSGTVDFGNNTLAGNSASGNGGALYNAAATVAMGNTLFTDNSAASGGAIFSSGGQATLNYSNLFGNSAPETVGIPAGTGNIAADPLYADADFRLAPGSPAVDRGNPATTLDVDFEDDFRPSDQGYDIGWDELVGCRAKRGTLTFGSIQDAINATSPVDLIQVTGICRGVHPLEVAGSTISQTVHLTQSLTIQGGWNGDFSLRTGEPTYVDPEGRGRGFYVSGSFSATIESLTILNGDASGLGGGPAGADAGGGIYNASDSTFRQVAVLTSTATLGGGFYHHSGSAHITLQNDPLAPAPGDGLANPWGMSEFTANSATNGGGLYHNSGLLTLDGVLLQNNSATLGGGLYNQSPSLTVQNGVFLNNNATSGGGLYNASGSLNLLHLTLFNNTASANGGGLYHGGGSLTSRSSIFQSNQAAAGSAIFVNGGTPNIDYNYYHTGQVVAGASQGANSVSSATPPGMVDPAGGDFHLVDGAPAADIADPNSPVNHDADNDPRPGDQGFDMGADEIAGCLVSLNGVLYGSLQQALADAQPGDVLRVSGICKGSTDYDIGGGGGGGSNACADGGIVRTSLFIDKSVTLQGGWDPEFLLQEDITTLDAQGDGHVIYIAPNITPTIEGFDIINGFVPGTGGSGGGICIYDSFPTITHNRLYSNTAANGAAIYSFNGAPIINGSRIFHNDGSSGALHLANTAPAGGDLPTLQNNFIYQNNGLNGGGIYNASGANQLWHNTIVSNTATTGGGLYVASGSPDVRGNVIMSNTATTTAGGAFGAAGSSAQLDYNDFFANINGNFGGTIAGDGPHGIAVDPLFVDIDTGAFTITFNSPVVDQGDPAMPLTIDHEGDLRPSHQGFDLGADEVGGCYARILSDPGTIYGSVQLAVGLALPGDTVQVDGTCRGVNNYQITPLQTVTQTLAITQSITLDGDWNYVSPMTATLDAGGSGRVLYIASGPAVTVTNIMLRNGAGDGAGLVNGGGAVLNTGDLALTNAALAENSGTQGGAVYNEGDLHLRSLVVYSSTASSGGALFQAAGTALVELSTFRHNQAAASGGALHHNGGELQLDGNRLFGNTAPAGGGIYLTAGPATLADIWNNFIYDNQASDGGGLFNNNSSGRIYHNSLIHNLATGSGAGLYNAGGSPDIRNNILDTNFGTGLHVNSGSPTADYNNVYGNTAGNYIGISAGPNDISAPPIYVDPGQQDYHLKDTSRGVDEGDITLPVLTDYDRDIRPTNDAPDMGADEVAACLIKVDTRIFGVLQTAIDYAEGGGFDTVLIARGECKGVQPRNGTWQVGYVSQDLQFIGSLRRTDFSDPDDFHNIYIGTVSSIINAEDQGRVIRVAPGAQPTFTHLAFVNGNASANGGSGDGGGIYNPDNGYPGFYESLVCSNTAVRGGGYFGGSSSNGDFSGGGLGACRVAQDIEDGSPPNYRSVYFSGNEATSDGGGLYFAVGALFDIRNYGIINNDAAGNGGGLFNGGTGRAINAILYYNSATSNGGGIYTSGDLELYHNTSRNNVALTGRGGAIYKSGSAQFVLNSSIIYANTAALGGGGVYAGSSNSTSRYNNYFSNLPNNVEGGIVEGTGSFNLEPRLYGWILSRYSPNIDRADPVLLDPPYEIDFDANNVIRPDGNPNHIQPPNPHRSDVGADEYFKDFGCTVDPNIKTQTAVPGSVITYTFTITNEGYPPPPSPYRHGYTDTITITLDSHTQDWTTMAVNGISGTLHTITLDWLDSAQAVITVTVPATATSGTQDTSVVRCRSSAIPERTKTGRAITNIGLVSSVLVEPDYVDDALPGDVLTYTHYITNIGNQIDTFAVIPSPGPAGATAAISRIGTTVITDLLTHTVTLAPAEGISVSLRVTILDTAAAGEVATPGVIARSVTDLTAFGAALNRISIGFIPGTRYVAGAGASDEGNNCTDPQQPCQTIQRAVDQAMDNDLILVAAGLYSDTVTRTLGATLYEQSLFIDKSVTIRGGYDAADEFTVAAPITNAVRLSGQDSRRVIYIADGVTVTLSSLFIQQGAAYPGALPAYGGGIYNAGANLTITGTWVLSNGAQFGGGLYHQGGALTIQSSVFAHNKNIPNQTNVYGEGGGLYIANGPALLENNTFADNHADYISSAPGRDAPGSTGNGGAIYLNQGNLTLYNSIFFTNTAEIGAAFYVSGTGSIDNDYNLFYSQLDIANVPTGPHSLIADPAFSDPFYHIGPSSAAKDRGSNGVSVVDGFDFELEDRQQGIAVDMGADERTQRPGFTLLPAGFSATIDPSQRYTYTHVLQNTGDFTDTYTLAMSNESAPPAGGWDYVLAPLSITNLPPGGAVTVTLVITGSPFAGYQNTTTITATNLTGLTRQAVDVTQIRQTPGVAIAPSREGLGNAGAAIAYTHTLTNTGDGVDEFFLSVASATPPDWVVTIVPTATGFVQPGSSLPFTVTVQVPAGTLSGTVHQVVVEANAYNPDASDRLTDTTTVLPTYALALAPDNAQTASAGSTVTYTHVLTNLGNLSDDFTLAVASGWSASVTPQAVSLPPLGTQQVTVVIQVPPDAGGQTDVAQVTATSLGSGLQATATNTTTVPSDVGVTLEPDYLAAAGVGTSRVYTHTLTNTGNAPDTFNLAASSSQGWLAGFTPGPISLAPAASATVLVTITIPAGAAPGSLDTTLITATSQLAPAIYDTATDQTLATAPGSLGVVIEPDNSDSGPAGAQIIYAHTVTNTGTITDLYSLAVDSSQSWPVDVAPTTLTLGPGEAAPVQVTVDIPAGTSAGTIDLTTVTATSIVSPTVADSATDTTTVSGGGTYGVLIAPDNAASGPAGQTVTYTHYVTNTGSLADTYTLDSSSSQSWAVGITPLVLSLAAGQRGQITVTVNIPAGTPAGTIDEATITVTSNGEPTVSDSATDTTTVSSSGNIAVLLEPDNETLTQWETTAIFNHTVSNTGQQAETFTLEASSASGWVTTISPTLVTLAPGEDQAVQVQLFVPDGVGGAVDITTVTARSTTEPAVLDTATDTTRITGIFMPIIRQASSVIPPTPTPTPSATPPPGPTPTPTPGACTPTNVDLIVLNVWVEPATPAGGQPATVYVSIKNQGSNNVPFGNNFYLDLYVDRVPAPLVPGDFDWGVQGSLMTAGAVRIFSTQWTFASGAHQLWAQVDTDNSVDECPHEDNNILGPVNIGVTGAAGDPAGTPIPPPTLDKPRSTPTPELPGRAEATPTPSPTVTPPAAKP